MGRNKQQINKKRFQIRKFVMASDVNEALKLESKAPVDGIWQEKQEEPPVNTNLIGFSIPDDDE